MMRRLVFPLLVFVTACPSEPSKPAPNVPNAPTAAASSSSDGAKLKFDNGANQRAFALKDKDDGAKLVDADENELARLKDKGDKTEVRTPDDVVVAIITGDADKLKIESPTREERFALKRYEDGDYKLKTAAGETLYVLKAKDYGFKIRDANGADVAKVKKSADKVKLKDAKGETLYETKADIPAIAVACLAFEGVALPTRVALLHRLRR